MIDRPIDAAFFAGRSVLITGGTGSLGRELVSILLRTSVARVAVLSRDELKQSVIARDFPDKRLRLFLGDVRDVDRLRRAFHGVDYVIHAAALKQVPAAEYNPFEATRTNVLGAQNVIDAAIDAGVERVAALSSDKASSPATLYGATKLVSDRLFVAGNAYSGGTGPKFSVVRYGNVLGSRGSLVSLLKDCADPFPLTDARMTRFWLSIGQAARFVCNALVEMHGGELFVPKLPGANVLDMIRWLRPGLKVVSTGIRPGEKLHEEMISVEAGRRTLDMGDYYVVQPEIDIHRDYGGGRAVPEDFSYRSDKNPWKLEPDELRRLLRE